MFNKKVFLLFIFQLVPLQANNIPWKSWIRKRETFSQQKEYVDHNKFRDEGLSTHTQLPPSLRSDQLQKSGTEACHDVTAFAKNAFQWSLIIFLARSIWQAVKEVLEEISLSDDSESDSQLLRGPYKVDSDKENSLIHRVAWKLNKCGIPLQSSSERSVESVLQSLTKSEASLLDQCLYIPSSHPTISGLNEVQEDLQRILDRFLRRDFSSLSNKYSQLFDDDKSHHVLLYGPPGMGKSLLIKKIACQIPTVLLTPSVLLRKYVGETSSRVRTLFTALQKIAPVLLCLDEVDGLFRERQMQEHEVNRDLKTEFLQWWDGLLSCQNIWIMAATNRPFEVDSAVLRRLPRQYYIGYPDMKARHEMLQNLLEGLPYDIDLNHVSHLTQGFTASDLRRLLQVAATECGNLDTLCTENVLSALERIKPTPQTPAYAAALQQFVSSDEQQPRQSYFHHHQIIVDPRFWDYYLNEDRQESDIDEDEF